MVVAHSIVGGLLIGGVYGLIAMGLSLVFGVLRIINFAHCSIMMIGMFATYWMWRSWDIDPYVSMPLVVLGLGAFGYLLQYFLLERMMNAPEDMQLIFTMGISFILIGSAQAVWGADFRTLSVSYGNASWNVAGVSISLTRLAAFIGAGVLALGLYLLLKKTNSGRAIRAVAEQPDAAAAVGINLARTRALAFGIATACVGFAGVMLSPFFYVSPQVGERLTLIAFVVVVLGGLGSTTGAFLAGILLGLVEGLGGAFMPGSTKDMLIFVVFILVLVFRPQGLLGRRAAL